MPFRSSSLAVSAAVSGLSPEISQLTYHASYTPFTPSESEQRSGHLYYRGCWHRFSRPFLSVYHQRCRVLTVSRFSTVTGVYNPKAFILHAASLRQGFPHCERFSTAATRRCLGRVSVPVWPTILSDRLPVVALVSLYLTNKLIGRGLVRKRELAPPLVLPPHAVLIRLSASYPALPG